MGVGQDLNTYKNYFDSFKKYIKDINNESEPKKHEGYFVNYTEYLKFENYIDDLINRKEKIRTSNYSQFLESNKIKAINFKKVKEKIINEKDEFILIDKNLYKVICKQNEYDKNNYKVKYKITPTYLIIFPENDSETICLNNKNNIINMSSIKKYLGVSWKMIRKIYKDIKHYYENETEIFEKLQEKEPHNYYGYLVDKKWVDEWDKYSSYNIIKESCLNKNISDKYIIKNFILNQQIKKKLNYYNIKNIKNFILQNQNDLNDLQKENKTYVLLNENFVKKFIDIQEIKISNFILSFQKISIKYPNKYELCFHTNNNIIQIGHDFINEKAKININNNINNEIYDSEILKNLLRHYYFKEELKSSDNSNIIKKKEAYIVKFDILNKLQREYNIMEIYNFLHNNGLLDGISYDNFNNNYPKICKYLNQNMNKKIKQIKTIETSGSIQFSKNESEFIPKIYNQQPSLKYFDGFVLIDKEFCSSLKKLFNESVNILKIFYSNYGNKMLLKIEFNRNYIYEIVKYNEIQSVEVKYIIEIIKKDKIDDFISVNNFLLLMNDIKNSVIISNPVKINENFVINLHQLDSINIINEQTQWEFPNNNNIITEIIKNEKFKKVIYLYCNGYSIILQKRNNNKDKEYYLIKKEYYKNIKKENNYDKLRKFINGKIQNILPNENELISILNSLSENELNIFLNILKEENKEKALPISSEIDKETIINPIEPGESFTILKNFELIEKNMMNNLIENKDSFYKMKVSFAGNNMAVFHYPINELNNTKYILVISIIDDAKNIHNKYLLIYEKPEYVSNHFDKVIKSNLNNYVTSLKLNITEILGNDQNKIGLIIKFPIAYSFNKLKDEFSKKPLIGLENLGDSYYINPTLQCLCNIETFAEYFKYDKNITNLVKQDKNNEKLSSEFKLLIDNIYPYQQSKIYEQNSSNNNNLFSNNQNNFYSAKKLKDKFIQMKPLINSKTMIESNDFINFIIMILETLHKELNVEQNIEDNVDYKYSKDKSNKKQMYKNFQENFHKKNCSIISELFYGINCNVTQCLNCKIKFYDYQNYFFLNFNLEEVEEYKLDNNSGMIESNMGNIINIYDCFNNNKKEIELNEEDAINCIKCNNQSKGRTYTTLTIGPEILIIILDRGNEKQENNIKIKFYDELHLDNYIELGLTGCHYELIGVISKEKNELVENYIAYCKSFFDMKWVKYNDILVSPINDVENEIFSNSIPYLLIYKKINHK